MPADRNCCAACQPQRDPCGSLALSARALSQVRLPSSVAYGECERRVGGPHVFGARLLWWCAAAKDPEGFDYSLDFRRQLWMLPIWTTLEGGTGCANPTPVEAISEAADAVCANLTAIAADARMEPPTSSPAAASGDTHSERMDSAFSYAARLGRFGIKGNRCSGAFLA